MGYCSARELARDEVVAPSHDCGSRIKLLRRLGMGVGQVERHSSMCVV